jgi:hypothetical protein
MKEKLKEFYDKDDIIIGSKQNRINIKSLNASTKENKWIFEKSRDKPNKKKTTKHMNLKITAAPKSFQIDIMFYPIGQTFKNVLLIVDIQSRKAWHMLYQLDQVKIF